MYIYHVSWAQYGSMGLNAVVAADFQQEAIEMLHLTDNDKCQKITIIGIALPTIHKGVFAHESL